MSAYPALEIISEPMNKFPPKTGPYCVTEIGEMVKVLLANSSGFKENEEVIFRLMSNALKGKRAEADMKTWYYNTKRILEEDDRFTKVVKNGTTEEQRTQLRNLMLGISIVAPFEELVLNLKHDYTAAPSAKQPRLLEKRGSYCKTEIEDMVKSLLANASIFKDNEDLVFGQMADELEGKRSQEAFRAWYFNTKNILEQKGHFIRIVDKGTTEEQKIQLRNLMLGTSSATVPTPSAPPALQTSWGSMGDVKEKSTKKRRLFGCLGQRRRSTAD